MPGKLVSIRPLSTVVDPLFARDWMRRGSPSAHVATLKRDDEDDDEDDNDDDDETRRSCGCQRALCS